MNIAAEMKAILDFHKDKIDKQDRGHGRKEDIIEMTKQRLD
jgi:hypothetical protein